MSLYTPLTGMSPSTPAPITDTGNVEPWDTIEGDARAYTRELKPRQDQPTSLLALSQSPLAGSTFSHYSDVKNVVPATTPQDDGRFHSPSADTHLMAPDQFWDSLGALSSPILPARLESYADWGYSFNHLYDSKSQTSHLEYPSPPPHNSPLPEPEPVGSHCTPVRELSAWRFDYKIGTGACGSVFLENVHLPGMKSPELWAVKRIPRALTNFTLKRYQAEIMNLQALARVSFART